jgi:signal transduction histidine kinase
MALPNGGERWSDRGSLRRSGLLGALLVVLTLGLAAALAYQAVRAAASHREAVEAALAHHAKTAAWRFAREARGWIGYGMNEAGDALQRDVAGRAWLPGPDILQELLAEKYCDCMSAAFGRTFVRLVAADKWKLEAVGEPLALRSMDALADTMRFFAKEMLGGANARQWRILLPGTPRLNRTSDVALLWRVTAKDKKPTAIYGMIVERAQIERPLIGALENAQFFPPTLISPKQAASLVRIDVAGPNGQAVFSRGPDSATFAGSDTLGVDYGRMVATATINPAAAQALVAGGLPQSNAPTIVALLVLALAMGGGAGLVLERSYRLARLREDFVSGVSHELRTPLTQIRMLSELLSTDGFKAEAEQTRAVDVIHRESLRLTNLVDNILEFARLRRAAPMPSSAWVSLAEVAREVAEALEPLLAAQNNRIEVAVPGDVTIRGDRDAVGRVLRNLIENAAKYGPAGQTIRVTLERANGGGRITVDDTGPGIPVNERTRIWQPYYRLDRDRNRRTGSGLGLSVVSDLVRALGGSVSVGDAPGGGARFTIDLPAAP